MMDKANYFNVIDNKVQQYRSSLGSQQLKTFWYEKTMSTSPREWSKKHLMPILCLIPNKEVQKAKFAFETLDKHHLDTPSIEKAKEYLENASFYSLLDNQGELDRIFTEVIIKNYAVMLTDIEEVKRSLDQHISDEPYDWFGNTEVEQILKEMARKKYYQGGSAKALEIIDRMDVAEVKRYLKDLIMNNMNVGMEIIKNN